MQERETLLATEGIQRLTFGARNLVLGLVHDVGEERGRGVVWYTYIPPRRYINVYICVERKLDTHIYTPEAVYV
jgi:hypothetical protein